MKLEKAIEILERFRDEGEEDLLEEVDPALNLGIAALRTIGEMRHYPFPDGVLLLPGETPGENPLPRLATCLNEAKDKGGTK